LAAALCIAGPVTAPTISVTRPKIAVKAGANSLAKVKNNLEVAFCNSSNSVSKSCKFLTAFGPTISANLWFTIASASLIFPTSNKLWTCCLVDSSTLYPNCSNFSKPKFASLRALPTSLAASLNFWIEPINAVAAIEPAKPPPGLIASPIPPPNAPAAACNGPPPNNNGKPPPIKALWAILPLLLCIFSCIVKFLWVSIFICFASSNSFLSNSTPDLFK